MKPLRGRSLARFPESWRPVGLTGQHVLVLGLGTFGGGLGAARYLLRQGADVTVADLRSAAELGEGVALLEQSGARMHLGGDQTAAVARCDWIVASPAVPLQAPPLLEAARRGVPVESEITLTARRLPCRWLGITGTNGKSTTAHLAHHLLSGLGHRCFLGGNLGGSLLEQVDEIRPQDVVVMELSSFQLEHLGPAGQGPDVAVVTNLTPDHLDRHGTFSNYCAAKAHILARADRAVLRADPTCRELARQFVGQVSWFGEEPGQDGWLSEGRFAIRSGSEEAEGVDLGPMALLGTHNRLNLVAAALAAESFGAPFERAVKAGLDAGPLPQRLEPVASVGGVRYVDDSVSTSPPAVIAALRSLGDGIHLLAGGYDKGIDLGELPEEIILRCREVYLFGAMATSVTRRARRRKDKMAHGFTTERRTSSRVGNIPRSVGRVWRCFRTSDSRRSGSALARLRFLRSVPQLSRAGSDVPAAGAIPRPGLKHGLAGGESHRQGKSAPHVMGGRQVSGKCPCGRLLGRRDAGGRPALKSRTEGSDESSRASKP